MSAAVIGMVRDQPITVQKQAGSLPREAAAASQHLLHMRNRNVKTVTRTRGNDKTGLPQQSTSGFTAGLQPGTERAWDDVMFVISSNRSGDACREL